MAAFLDLLPRKTLFLKPPGLDSDTLRRAIQRIANPENLCRLVLMPTLKLETGSFAATSSPTRVEPHESFLF